MSERKNEANPEPAEAYWFNLKTRQVEFGKLSPALFRVGPFETREDAERAPELLAERARAWREDEESDS